MPNPAIICHDNGSSVLFTSPRHPVEKLLVVESLYPTRIDNLFGFDGGGLGFWSATYLMTILNPPESDRVCGRALPGLQGKSLRRLRGFSNAGFFSHYFFHRLFVFFPKNIAIGSPIVARINCRLPWDLPRRNLFHGQAGVLIVQLNPLQVD